MQTSTWYQIGRIWRAVADGLARTKAIMLAPNLSLVAGTVLGQITAAAVNAVQTLTQAATGGTFTLTYNGQTTAALAWNSTAAQIQAALGALTNIGAAQVSCTGGPLGTGSVAITFQGSLQGMPIAALTINGGNLTGGSLTVATTTTGVAGNRYTAYSGLVDTPATAPTVAGAGTGGTWPAGDYLVEYTYVTAAGESTPSPNAGVTLTSGQNISITSLTGLDGAVTAVNVYVNGSFAYQKSVSAGATGTITVAGPSASAAIDPPTVNTAYKASDGSQIPLLILEWDCTSDDHGNVMWGQSATSEFGVPNVNATVPAFYSGTFQYADLVGLDANAQSKLGRFISGSASASGGLFRIA